MSNDIHVERLRTLYSVIAGIPKTAIELYTWREHDLSNEEMLSRSCGTTACAIGWACAYPEFNRQGLYWGNTNATFDIEGYRFPIFRNQKETFVSWRAVEKFFGLTEEQAEYLFNEEESYYNREVKDKESLFLFVRCEKRLVLSRIRYHLLQIGAITKGRYLELESQEKRGIVTA